MSTGPREGAPELGAECRAQGLPRVRQQASHGSHCTIREQLPKPASRTRTLRRRDVSIAPGANLHPTCIAVGSISISGWSVCRLTG